MLKCPNCGTQVDLTWKKYFRAVVFNKIICSECSRRLAVDLPDWFGFVMLPVGVVGGASFAIVVAHWLDAIFYLNKLEVLLSRIFALTISSGGIACILKPLGENLGQ